MSAGIIAAPLHSGATEWIAFASVLVTAMGGVIVALIQVRRAQDKSRDRMGSDHAHVIDAIADLAVRVGETHEVAKEAVAAADQARGAVHDLGHRIEKLEEKVLSTLPVEGIAEAWDDLDAAYGENPDLTDEEALEIVRRVAERYAR